VLIRIDDLCECCSLHTNQTNVSSLKSLFLARYSACLLLPEDPALLTLSVRPSSPRKSPLRLYNGHRRIGWLRRDDLPLRDRPHGSGLTWLHCLMLYVSQRSHLCLRTRLVLRRVLLDVWIHSAALYVWAWNSCDCCAERSLPLNRKLGPINGGSCDPRIWLKLYSRIWAVQCRSRDHVLSGAKDGRSRATWLPLKRAGNQTSWSCA
jgi:hypothetical protein